MNALFIDDNENSIAPAMDIFMKNSADCRSIKFENYEEEISNQKPDIVILDMMNGSVTDDPAGSGGNGIFSKIWEQSFCPIIIYSANPDLSCAPDHPFICKVTKESGSEDNVWQKATEFNSYLLARKTLYSSIENVLNETLRDTATAIFQAGNREQVDSVLLRLTRRRIAALMDNGLDSETLLHPYEQYIFPVVGKDWLQGDIIKHKNDNSFFLVLTPSCDLVKRDGRIKAGTILCAKCCKYDKSLLRPFLKSQKAKKCEVCSTCTEEKNTTCDGDKTTIYQKQKAQELTAMLNAGIVGKYFVLPEMSIILPKMLADFKNYLLIEFDEMDKFERIVSIDSPFREQLSWAFISIAGRPGMPDRDFSDWASENI